jgi:hypothetical protein
MTPCTANSHVSNAAKPASTTPASTGVMEPGQRPPGHPRRPRPQQHPADLEGEQQLHPGHRALGSGRPRRVPDLQGTARLTGYHDTEGNELAGHQIADVTGGYLPADSGSHAHGNPASIRAAVRVAPGDGLRHQVQQPGQLNHLPVGPPDQEPGLGKSAAVVLPEKTKALSQP